jgi:Cu+-exporting ATPase
VSAAALRFEVGGMHCASCARRVEETLRQQQGVREAAVNFATAQARVLAAPELDVDALRHAVDEAGFTLTAVAGHSDLGRGHGQSEARTALRRFAGAGLCSAPVFVLAMLGVEGAASRLLQAALATLVVFGFGAPFHRGAWSQARQRAANMDTLISLGTLAAFGASLWALLRGGPLYFETAAVIVTLILLGRTLETRARLRASDAVARLAALGAREACVLRDGGEVRVPIEALQPGDELVIRPGETVPTDAVVLEGRSAFDQSAFTGEPLPVDKGPGDELFGASVNGHGRVRARATRVGRETALARIIHLVEETQASKAPVQRLADRTAGVFVPVVIGVAALTLLGWWASGSALTDALERAVAVLVIACPCALGLATPTAILVGSGRGAELGILFKGGEIFERSRAIDTVVFDKTGTLTRGSMSLAEVVSDEADFLRLVASLEDASEHPVARAVAAGARQRDLALEKVQDFEAQPGRGVSGRISGTLLRVGSVRWMQELGIELRRAAEPSSSAPGTSERVGSWRWRTRRARAPRAPWHGCVSWACAWASSPATTAAPPRRWHGSSASTTCAPRRCPRTRARGSGSSRLRARAWPSSATASTMRRPSPRPTSASPSARARTSRSQRATWCS